MFGGGRRYFYKSDQQDPETGKVDEDDGRKDGLNLIDVSDHFAIPDSWTEQENNLNQDTNPKYYLLFTIRHNFNVFRINDRYSAFGLADIIYLKKDILS